MAYTDYLRDHVRIDQAVHAADGGGGHSTTWLAMRTVPCRAYRLRSFENLAYRREGHTNVVRLVLDDRTIRTDRSISLDDLLLKEGEAKFRLVFKGKPMLPIAINRPSEGVHDYLNYQISIDCEYEAEDTGYPDLT